MPRVPLVEQARREDEAHARIVAERERSRLRDCFVAQLHGEFREVHARPEDGTVEYEGQRYRRVVGAWEVELRPGIWSPAVETKRQLGAVRRESERPPVVAEGAPAEVLALEPPK